MNSRRTTDPNWTVQADGIAVTPAEREILDEDSLRQSIVRERQRTDRSNQPFLLVLLDLGKPHGKTLTEIVSAFSLCIRETDIVGWYSENTVLGIIFTELSTQGQGSIVVTMTMRITEILRKSLSMKQVGHMAISCYAYPESLKSDPQNHDRTPALYPDFYHQERRQRPQRLAKRAIDIVGSSAALLAFSPVILVTAVLVKLSSKGPLIYKQQRLGQCGRTFELLKFRSMRVGTDTAIHREFMKNVIAGTHDGIAADGNKPVYKMTNDPRITPIGRFLRRYSLDELPQFVNVLRGEMSLVGPRPPLQYEFEEYQLWHRRRVLEAQPGITGLWQVQGRSRVRFDDMVRLDLQYVRTWSLWLDLRILFKTPAAVLLGDDAF